LPSVILSAFLLIVLGWVITVSVSLYNRQILVGITGGIAAYKAAELVRRLQDCGAVVRVVMTPAAIEFVTPLTLQALSGHPVHTGLLDQDAEAGMGHIELARWADRILIAPASADFMARLAQGQADDLLSAICLATAAPVIVAAAMNQAMWSNPATQANAALLKKRGVTIWGPADGLQACGDVGPGRMLEVSELIDNLSGTFEIGSLAGVRVMITAGPTREAIDPVRYISNHSSGKMGFALAQAAIDAGAVTTLVSGPVQIQAPSRLKLHRQVIAAQEMLEAVNESVADVDIFIAAAAVADFRPSLIAQQKIKKGESDGMTLELIRNPDIVAAVALMEDGPFVVGFAAETESVEENARSKLHKKNLNVVIANDVSDKNIGFDSSDNAVQVYWRSGERSFERMSKPQLAENLIELLSVLYKKSFNKSEE
jgi:phosphopantothenoylcysteine decarboxylase/phosphopantothenate--cysteine ligase